MLKAGFGQKENDMREKLRISGMKEEKQKEYISR